MNSAKRSRPPSETGGSEQVSAIQRSKVNILTSPAEGRQAQEMEADGETMTSGGGGGGRENLRLHRSGMQTGIQPPRARGRRH